MSLLKFSIFLYVVVALWDFVTSCHHFGIQVEKKPWLAGFQRREMVLYAAFLAFFWPLQIIIPLMIPLTRVILGFFRKALVRLR